MAIVKLPEEVKSAVRNGITVSSTSQCVAELVYNSLDADADSIFIHLDVSQYKLQVFDNGSGISFENLKNCGIRYNTSKCRSLSDIKSNLKFYGYRGEALASIVASSGTVVILTRPKSDGHTYCKTFSKGKPHYPTKSITSRTCPGTTVTVQNFMYNAPVRQQRMKPNIDVEEVRLQVEGLALAHPHVSFTIQDETDNSTILNISKSQSTLETFSKLYGKEICSNLFPVGPLDSGKHKLCGFISKSSHHNKKLQFVFVNGKLVKKTKVHKLINMIMRKSDVLRGNGPWQELPLPERVRDFLWVSPNKKRYRYCVFVINISCSLMEYDMTLDPEKTLVEFSDWDSLLECTEKLVKDFLKQHNLAYVASDTEIGETEEGNISVLNEVIKLEEEESLRSKLDRFKHDSAKQDDPKTFTARTIRSFPAKRTISNQKKNKGSKNSRFTLYRNRIQSGKKDKNDSTCSKSLTSPSISPTEINCASTNSQSMNDKGSDDDNPANAQRGNPEDNISAEFHSSLSKFRKLFSLKDTVPLKTPADHIIKVEMPPPIIRRKNPLDHRIKAVLEQERSKTSNTVISSANNAIDLEKKEIGTSQKNIRETDSIEKERSTLVDGNAKYFVNAQLPTNVEQKSGYFKKRCPTTSVATQTVCNCSLAREKPTNCMESVATQTLCNSISLERCKQNNFLELFSKKPNLKNIHLRMKQLSEFQLVCNENTTNMITDNSKNDKNIDESSNKDRNGFYLFTQLSNGNIVTETSKALSEKEGNSYFPSVNDFICAQGGKDDISESGSLVELNNDMMSIASDLSKGGAPAVNDKSVAILSILDECYKLKETVSNDLMIRSNHPAEELMNQSAQNSPEMVLPTSDECVADVEALPVHHENTKEDKSKRSLEIGFKLENEKVVQPNDLTIAVKESQVLELMESGYTSDNANIVPNDELSRSEVVNHNHFKAGQKRSSNNDSPKTCIIKKALLDINLDSKNSYSLDVNESEKMEKMKLAPPVISNDDVQESGCDAGSPRIAKENDNFENDDEDLQLVNMDDTRKNGCSDCKINRNYAEVSVDKSVAKEKSFEMFARTPFLPKGLSPVFRKDLTKSVTLRKNSPRKLPSENPSLEGNSGNDVNGAGLISSYLSEMENKKYIAESKVMSAYNGTQNKSIMKIFNLIYPCTFSKSLIAKFKMLGRLDDKFIVAHLNMEEGSSSGSLVLFDQHAVHERIRLERLMKEYVTENEEKGKSFNFKYKSVSINPPLEITVTAPEIRIMGKFTENFEMLGLSYEKCSENEEVIRITSIPACLSSKDANELGPLGLKERILALIREQMENLVTTRGVGTFSPEVLRDAINMEACKGAVKFGDVLSHKQCRWLLRNLAKCDSPFQCAHGRPSMYPIAAMSHLEKHWSVIELERPCLKKIKQFM